MPRRTLFALLLLLPSAPLRAADPPAVQWVVVTAPAYRKAVEPLCEHRKGQGLHVEVVQTTDVLSEREVRAGEAEKLCERVVKLCRDFKGTSYVLLVGAVEAGDLADAGKKMAPPLPGTAGRMKGQPSDNGYGSPGDELLPAIAVGRLPARSEDEARRMVGKILAYEKDDTPGEWRRRLTVLAGAPEFNPAVDSVIERQAIAQLGHIDPSWGGRALYHNPSSRFTLPDEVCHERACAYVAEGQALTLYLGHSNAQGFWANRSRYLDRDDWTKLSIKRGPGVFATFGCFGCELCGKDGEGYGVAAVRNPNGPVAVIGSHGECFAAMVKLASEGFTESFLGPTPPERLGESFLTLKRGLARGKIDGLTFRLLDAVDGDSSIPQAVQRREHEEMFVLLGDPALRLPWLRRDVKLSADGPAAPGGRLVLKGTAPKRLEGAKVQVTLERPRDSDPPEMVVVPKGPAEARAKAMEQRHEAANDFVMGKKELTVKDGRFEAVLDLPAKLPWRRLIVRAYAATDRQEAMGVVVVPIREGE
jgi:Peptidase family C25